MKQRITVEQLQAMSDAELDELAATKVMGMVKNKRGCYLLSPAHDDWFSPTTDMNDAYKLLQMLKPKWAVSIGYNLSGWEVGLWTGVSYGDKYVSATDLSLPKAITIASILAKE